MLKFFRFSALILFYTNVFPNPSFSQHNDQQAYAAYAEKIYLQLDSKVYTTDRTIWYKCIVTSAIDHAPYTLSGVLYVELIAPDEDIVDKKTIKIENGIGEGFFELSERYIEGPYLIRAYTEWNKNFEEDFFFKEYIQVYTPSSKVKKEPISNVTLFEKPNGNTQLSASLDPFVIDSLHEKDLTLIIITDEKKDTLSIKKSRKEKYKFDYAVSAESDFVTLQLDTRNHYSFSKTIALNEDSLDLRFFPESGELVQGLRSKVGFKAVDYKGKGIPVEGEIINAQNEILSTFKSYHLGMGYFFLSSPDSSERFYARLKAPPEGSSSRIYPLPEFSAIGNVLSINKMDDKVLLKASSNYLKNDSIYIRAACRGVVYYDLGGRLKEGTLRLSLPANMLPEGIIALTMMDNNMQPVAERLYFNERPESRIRIQVQTGKEIYSQRELSKVNIETTNNIGKAVKANLSLLVINKKQMGQMQSMRQNILSFFLLNSDLRGEIEYPGMYFGSDTVMFDNLDALLLTQGWRKYNYTKPFKEFQFRPEPGISVTGSVSGALSQRRTKKDVELTMMTFDSLRSVQSQVTDSLGRFLFYVEDHFGQDLNIVIQSAKKSGKKKTYTISTDRKESPPVSYDHSKSIKKADSVVNMLVEKNIERKIIEDAYLLSSGAIELEEVVIEGYNMTPERQKVTDRFGIPDQIISGKAIEEEEMDWSSGLYSVLKQKFPDKIIIRKYYTRWGVFQLATVNRDMTLLFIDGEPVNGYEYQQIPYIPPSEVSSFEIIENVENFASLYLEVFPSFPAYWAPREGGSIIAIYTHAGIGLAGTTKPKGILRTSIPVFSPKKEFYAPKYENLKPDDWYKPDFRALVRWEPNIVVDSIGKASTSFYNADNIGEMLIVVEAISENGELGYKEITYNVEKNDNGY